jgi:hypothetical protein
MDVIGTKIIVTHPGFAGANFFGVIDISNPAAPTWTAKNTAINGLPSVPTSVSNYNNRAYFACGHFEYYSDVLIPDQITNGAQALSIGDTTPIVGQEGLPVTTLSGGVAGALLVFKAGQIWQITGDASATPNSTLALNFVSLTVGCTAPATISPAPDGTYFMGPDAVYMVDALGGVRPLKLPDIRGSLTPDIQVPFQMATTPSRACGAYNSGVYRIAVDTIIRGQAIPAADYWFDGHPRRWNGPHTFNYHVIVPIGNYFVLASNTMPGKLFKSEVYPSLSSVYLDNGSVYQCDMLPCMMPKTKGLTEHQVCESSTELSSPGVSASYSITAVDETGAVLGNAAINTALIGGLWGGVVWGSFVWGSSIQVPGVYGIPWTQPVVFQKMATEITAQAVGGLTIGTQFHRYQDTGYANSRLLYTPPLAQTSSTVNVAVVGAP